MDIQPIKTEQDYEAALAEVEALWRAEIDTADGDRLDVLAIIAICEENLKQKEIIRQQQETISKDQEEIKKLNVFIDNLVD